MNIYSKEDVGHYSDCAIYNEPAFKKGKCNCGFKDRMRKLKAKKIIFNNISNEMKQLNRSFIVNSKAFNHTIDNMLEECEILRNLYYKEMKSNES